MKKEAIVLKYSSTRGNAEQLDSAQAIIRGLAADGGLFVPDAMPKVDMAFIEGLKTLSYEERAEKVLGLFLTDYTAEELSGCVTRAYGNGRFDTAKRAPVKAVGDKSVLELWHGPTSAFKDMALQLLPQLMSTALKKTGEKDEVLILVATSGDTGKAALEGFRDVPQIRIMVFYPQGGVSRIQQLQMLTQEGHNVNVTAVTGNFDDAQTGVKKIFTDPALKAELAQHNKMFSSANSINWGRLLPQIVYYFSAYLDLVNAKKIKMGDAINVVVPTGNFGNILASYYAKRMGLPVHKFICASNSNNVLTDFIRTGTYDKKRAFYTTISPSMDILISSNLERLLYHLCGEDTEKLTGWMNALQSGGAYTVDAATADAVRALFYGGCCDDKETVEVIRNTFEKDGYLCDTHTAVAVGVYEQYLKETGDNTPAVIASTASPYKFPDSVLDAFDCEKPADPFAEAELLAKLSNTKIPAPITALRTKPVRFENTCAAADMADFVRETVRV